MRGETPTAAATHRPCRIRGTHLCAPGVSAGSPGAVKMQRCGGWVRAALLALVTLALVDIPSVSGAGQGERKRKDCLPCGSKLSLLARASLLILFRHRRHPATFLPASFLSHE